MKNPNTVLCSCSKFDQKYIDKNHQHILTSDLEIISSAKFKKKLFLKVLDTENLLIYTDKKRKHKLLFI